MHFSPWAADVSDLSLSQLCSVWNKELDFGMNKMQDKTELKKSVVQSVLLCLSYIFIVYFDKQVHKKTGKIN